MKAAWPAGLLVLLAAGGAALLWPEPLPQEPVRQNAAPNAWQLAASATRPLEAAPAPLPPPQAQDLMAELRRLRDCHASSTCGFAQPDPRAAHFAAVQAMKTRLQQLAGRHDEATLQLAVEFLQVADGHVQSAALALLAAQAPRADHSAAVIAMLAGNHDAVLLQQALPLLARWRAAGLTQGLDDTLIALLHTGSHQVGLALSSELLPLLNREALPRYQALLAQLPEGRKREQLAAALTEFQRLQHGA